MNATQSHAIAYLVILDTYNKFNPHSSPAVTFFFNTFAHITYFLNCIFFFLKRFPLLLSSHLFYLNQLAFKPHSQRAFWHPPFIIIWKILVATLASIFFSVMDPMLPLSWLTPHFHGGYPLVTFWERKQERWILTTCIPENLLTYLYSSVVL